MATKSTSAEATKAAVSRQKLAPTIVQRTHPWKSRSQTMKLLFGNLKRVAPSKTFSEKALNAVVVRLHASKQRAVTRQFRFAEHDSRAVPRRLEQFCPRLPLRYCVQLCMTYFDHPSQIP